MNCPEAWQQKVVDKLEHHEDKWFGPLPNASILKAGYSTFPDADDTKIRLRPDGQLLAYVFPKAVDGVFTGFIANRQHSVGDEILVLAKESKMAEVWRVLQQLNGGEEVAIYPRRNGLPEGWLAFRRFEAKCRAKHCPTELEHLQPSDHVVIHLENGLKFGREEWLEGALPHIKVTGSRSAFENLVTINTKLCSLNEQGYIENLETFIDRSGLYRVQAGKRNKSFWVKAPEWPLPTSGQEEKVFWNFEFSSNQSFKPLIDCENRVQAGLRIRGVLVEGELPFLPEIEVARSDFDTSGTLQEIPESHLDKNWFDLASKILMKQKSPYLPPALLPKTDSEALAQAKKSPLHALLFATSLDQNPKAKLLVLFSQLQAQHESHQVGQKP